MPTHKQHAALRKGRSHPKAQALKKKMMGAAKQALTDSAFNPQPIVPQQSEALPEWVTPPYPQP